MLAEVRLVVEPKEARLTMRHGDGIVENEVWTYLRPMGRTEANELVRTVFDSTYDMMNFVSNHGDTDE